MNNKNKLLTAIIFLVIIISIAAGVYLVSQNQNLNEKAAPTTDLSFSPVSGSVVKGQGFSTNVKISTGTNLVTGVDIELTYNPQAIQLTQIAPTQALSNFTNPATGQIIKNEINNTAGTARFIAYTLNKALGVTGQQNILVVTGTSLISAQPATYQLNYGTVTSIAAVNESQNSLLSKSLYSLTITNPTPTPSPTPSPSPTPTKSPSPTPTVSPTAISTAVPTGSVSGGIIVPLYTFPGATWTQMISSKLAHPTVSMVAIVNPSNGPGSSVNSSYTSGINNLRSAGIKVLGYVYTQYGARDPKPDIDKWKSFYNIDGIFFDEMSNQVGMENFYSDLNTYAKSKGYTFTVGNPGVDTKPSYIGTMDNIMIYESAGLPSLSSLGGWHSSYNKDNFTIIPYGVTNLDTGYIQSAKNYVGFIYITNDTLPNPWDSLPPYFDNLVSLLDTGVAQPTSTPSTAAYPAWDVDQNGLINVVDIGLVVDDYGNPSPVTPRADVDKNGIINIIDIGIIVDHYL